MVAVHYVPCLCLQAVLRCPGNTDGGWRARIQKTINLWQQLETEISHSFSPGCCQKTSLFTLAAVVLFLCPEASVFYLIPACGPDRSGSDRTTVSAVGGTPTSASICSAAMYDATPRIALARTGVCRSKERERLPLCYFFIFYLFLFFTAGGSYWSQHTACIYRSVQLVLSVRRNRRIREKWDVVVDAAQWRNMESTGEAEEGGGASSLALLSNVYNTNSV